MTTSVIWFIGTKVKVTGNVNVKCQWSLSQDACDAQSLTFDSLTLSHKPNSKPEFLVLSNFSFCHNVFKSCLLHMRQIASTHGKGLNTSIEIQITFVQLDGTVCKHAIPKDGMSNVKNVCNSACQGFNFYRHQWFFKLHGMFVYHYKTGYCVKDL